MQARYSHGYIVLGLLALSHLESILCLKMTLNYQQKRCVKVELSSDDLVVGNYEIPSAVGSTIDLTIEDSSGQKALQRENIEGIGKFAVTSDKDDVYDVCFQYVFTPGVVVRPEPREVGFSVRLGAEAKEYERISNDDLSEIEADLNRIEDLSNSMIGDYAHLKKRGQEMHDSNARTAQRLFYQAIVSFVLLLTLSGWQVFYLRTYFKAKKILD